MGTSKATNGDVNMPDAPHSTANPTLDETEAQLDEEFPDRPRNTGRALPFHDLIHHVFDPINDVRQKPKGAQARARLGPHGPVKRSPQEESRIIVEQFIDQWRAKVGPDLYPVFRLILPDKDSERPNYGLKEVAIGKQLAKVMGIDKNSEDGQNLQKWKVPGKTAAARMAGDFAGRCYEVLNKRPIRSQVGNMTVDEVNALLDRLSLAGRETEKTPIFAEFYAKMNPTELMWLIRMILRQPLKFGSSHETIFRIFHPDAVPLFNVTSSLRKVCWTLYDPEIRLDDEDTAVVPMQCFQPQLAQFQPQKAKTFERIVANLQPTQDDPEFWIEEKLDGERMQLHMIDDPAVKGGKRFGFWSRRATDYKDLYGYGFFDPQGALTRHLQNAFDPGVRSIILDGEMVTWDPNEDAMVDFGSLKTAAKDQQRNAFSTGNRPLYRVFDIVYLNGLSLTNYTLRDRRKALNKSLREDPEHNVRGVFRRIEVHQYKSATSAEEIEPVLRKVMAEAGEGLVLKSPRSPYRLNERNDDWMKVKPEYMTEFGEQLDCIVVGAYYGSGKRGGSHSSFLCGLLVNRDPEASDLSNSQRPQSTQNPQLTFSFFKVGGGFKAQDYATIRHLTEGKWHPWNASKPPRDWVELAGGDLQYERPDEWIKPEDSVVLQVKAADVRGSDQFRTRITLRFPRFVALRKDKDWTSALSLREFKELHDEAQRTLAEQQEQKMQIDDTRRKRLKHEAKKIKVAGGTIDDVTTAYAGPETKVFEGLTFFVMTDSIDPDRKMKKPEIEQFVKANGGGLVQTHDAFPHTICVADRRSVKVAALEKPRDVNLVRPKWLLDCVAQSQTDNDRTAFLLPFEPAHMLFTREDEMKGISEGVDDDGDSYCRDVTASELQLIFDRMRAPRATDPTETAGQKEALRRQLEDHGHGIGTVRGQLFEDLTLYFNGARPGGLAADIGSQPASSDEVHLELARMTARFAAANITDDIADQNVTHVVSVLKGPKLKELRKELTNTRRAQPRIVSTDWVLHSWDEETQLAEERYAVA